MPQIQQKKFPGYGVVYPDGITGIKVVKTFTQAPTRIVNPDGSISHTIPPPTIHELHGGGFTYASGKLVNNREHLEMISDENMRERALVWFDTHGKVMNVEIVEKPEESVRPEPDFILSSQLPQETDEVTKSINEQVEKEDSNLALAKAVSELTKMIVQQGKEIAELKKGPPPPEIKPARKKQSEVMKAKWADPAFRQRRMAKKGRVQGGQNETYRHEVAEKIEGTVDQGGSSER